MDEGFTVVVYCPSGHGFRAVVAESGRLEVTVCPECSRTQESPPKTPGAFGKWRAARKFRKQLRHL